jgi:hypothetical protein
MTGFVKSTATALVLATMTASAAVPAWAASSLAPAPALPPATSAARSMATWGDAAKYRQVMELNGTSRNARLIMANSRKAVLTAIEERKGTLSPSERQRFDALADASFSSLTEQVLALIAADQSPTFTDAEIDTLIAANTGQAAATYHAARLNDEGGATEIQGFMVDSVVEIIRTFRDNGTIAPAAEANDPNTVLTLELLRVDGTDQVVRYFISTVHLQLIMAEVQKYIDIPNLDASDSARLTLLFDNSLRKLGTRILTRNARVYGQALGAEQLRQLIRANDTEAQRKLTRLRLESDDTDAKTEALMLPVIQDLAKAFGVEDE